MSSNQSNKIKLEQEELRKLMKELKEEVKTLNNLLDVKKELIIKDVEKLMSDEKMKILGQLIN